MKIRKIVEILRLSGKQVEKYLEEVASLRISVFREFPYLYDGSAEYETDYLRVYAESPRSVFVLAIEDGKVVGASTGVPLVDADEAFRKPFVNAGIDPASVYYFGESVLEKSYRGRGIGHRFFDEREAHAREHGFKVTAFCAVERDAGHPLKPDDYRSNDAFWIKRGYTKTPELAATLEWQQVDETEEVLNALVFWVKRWE